MPEPTEEGAFRALKAVLVLLGNEKLQNDLKDDERFQEFLGTMDMPESARGELLNILTRVEQLVSKSISPQPPEVVQDDRYEKMQLETFDHIRTSFWVALAMSIALFLIGFVLLSIAVSQAVHEPSVSTSTLTIAGLGLADFVLLFFRRPWQEVSVNLSNSQQVRTIATSYLVGLALLQRGDTKTFEMLGKLTEHSVVMLQQYAEERDSDNKDTSKDTAS